MLHRLRLDLGQLHVEAFDPQPPPGSGPHAVVEPDPNATMHVNESDCCVSVSCLSFVARPCC